MTAKVSSMLDRTLILLSTNALFVGTFLLAGCSGLRVSGVGSTSEGNADGAGKVSVESASAPDPTEPLFARAKTGEGHEFAVFVHRADDGPSAVLREISIQLADGTIVTAITDDTRRPVRFEDGDSSLTIIHHTSDATVVCRNETGETSEMEVALPEPEHTAARLGAAFQTVNRDILCGDVLTSYRPIVQTVLSCTETPGSPLCETRIAEATVASVSLCSADAVIVPEAQLETTIEDDRDVLALSVVPSVVALADTRNGSGEVIVELEAIGSGGIATFTIAWEIVDGAVRPAIAEGATTERFHRRNSRVETPIMELLCKSAFCS